MLKVELWSTGHFVHMHTIVHLTHARRGSQVGWKSEASYSALMAAKSEAMVERGCWQAQVATSKKLAIVPTVSSQAGGKARSCT